MFIQIEICFSPVKLSGLGCLKKSSSDGSYVNKAVSRTSKPGVNFVA